MPKILTREEVIETGLLTAVRGGYAYNTIRIPDQYDTIGEGAFMYSPRVYTVVIPGSVKSIGKKAFKNCPNLHDVVLEEGVESIHDYAFWGCSRLMSITLPKSIKNVGLNVLDGTLKYKSEDKQSSASPASSNTIEIRTKTDHKGGFADIAGLDYLKERLQSDIINVIREPDRAKSLGINLPNGLLLYGPPGCGKTYFAEKFAEEAGFNFQIINCSDIASIYVHGTQEEIAKIFKNAKEKAPTILFFDEIEAMIPNRNSSSAVHTKTETNEFLTQLNGCGKHGVVVIGATNRPQDIDPAALRAGRLEMKVYLPQPDLETREKLFAIKLRGRKIEGEIYTETLAKRTENYVSADITMIVEQTARMAFRLKKNAISMELIEQTLNEYKPTVPLNVIREHEHIRDQFENQEKNIRKPIGFA